MSVNIMEKFRTSFGDFEDDEKVWYDVFPLVRHAPGRAHQFGIESVGCWKQHLNKQGVSSMCEWEDVHDVKKRRKNDSEVKMKDIKY